MSISKILNSRNFQIVSKPLARALGIEQAYLLGFLSESYDYFNTRGQLREGGGFFVTAADMEAETGLSTRAQGRVLEALNKAGIIEQRTKKNKAGAPCRFFFFMEGAQKKVMDIIYSDTCEFAETQNGICENAKTNLQKRKMEFAKMQNDYKDKDYKDKDYKDKEVDNTKVLSPSLEVSEIACAIPLPSDEFFEFDNWAIQNQLYELLKFPARLKEKKLREKKKELGDAFFYKVMLKINEYVKRKPEYIHGLPATARKKAVEGRKQLANVMATFIKTAAEKHEAPAPTLRNVYVEFWNGIAHGAPCIIGKQDLINLKELAQKLKQANQDAKLVPMSEDDLLRIFLKRLPPYWRIAEKATPFLLNRDCATIVSQMHSSKNKYTPPSPNNLATLDLQAGLEKMEIMERQRTEAPKAMAAMADFYTQLFKEHHDKQNNE